MAKNLFNEMKGNIIYYLKVQMIFNKQECNCSSFLTPFQITVTFILELHTIAIDNNMVVV